jgi:hypothetical protein
MLPADVPVVIVSVLEILVSAMFNVCTYEVAVPEPTPGQVIVPIPASAAVVDVPALFVVYAW